MSLNLINDAWLPARRLNGEQTVIKPFQVCEDYHDNPFIAFDAPRADFNGALIQFLIGLVQTIFAPKNALVWRKYLKEPPSPDELKEAFAKVAYAFNLDGDGPRFMQDLTLAQEI